MGLGRRPFESGEDDTSIMSSSGLACGISMKVKTAGMACAIIRIDGSVSIVSRTISSLVNALAVYKVADLAHCFDENYHPQVFVVSAGPSTTNKLGQLVQAVSTVHCAHSQATYTLNTRCKTIPK